MSIDILKHGSTGYPDGDGRFKDYLTLNPLAVGVIAQARMPDWANTEKLIKRYEDAHLSFMLPLLPAHRLVSETVYEDGSYREQAVAAFREATKLTNEFFERYPKMVIESVSEVASTVENKCLTDTPIGETLSVGGNTYEPTGTGADVVFSESAG